jgi:hypothetical protein
MSKLRLSAKVMNSHEITFNPNLPEEARTRADFTYKIMPKVISIIDTGLGSRPVSRLDVLDRDVNLLQPT